jgi:RNA polymerase sigma-70 factor (ECF subfamily)
MEATDVDGECNGAAEALEKFRSYLLFLARQQLGHRLQAVVDASGVVNQTLFEAHREYAKVEGRPEPEVRRWLQAILAHNLNDATRAFTGPTRDRNREVSIEASLEESSARLAQCLEAQDTSPSQKAVRNEDYIRLTRALEGLPDDQRMAVECHHLQGLSLAETAELLGKTKAATAGLVYRGLNKLREMLIEAQ